MKEQTKRASLFESIVSNLVGFLLTIVAQFYFFVQQTLEENLAFSTLLLGLHIIRSYCLRRAFNARAAKLARERKARKKASKHAAMVAVETEDEPDEPDKYQHD